MSFPMIAEASPDTFIRSEKQNLVGVKVTKEGAPYLLQGTVSALFMKPDGTSFEINQNGSVHANKASITLPNQCYDQDGRIQIAIILTNGTDKTTLGVCRGIVYPTRL